MRPTRWRRSTHLAIGASVVALVAVVVAVAALVTGGRKPDDPQIAAAPAPAAADPAVVPVADGAPMPTSPGLARALALALSDPNLGNITGRITDADTGDELWRQRDEIPMQPASTNKSLTAAAALLTLDRDARLTTRVVAANQSRQPGVVVLVGGGDPTLSAAPVGEDTWYRDAARISDLAAEVRKSGMKVTAVKVDTSLYTGPDIAPGWDPADIDGGDIAPIEPVMLDAGRTQPTTFDSRRSRTPALDAGRALAVALRVDPATVTVVPGPPTGRELASVESAPLIERLRQMMNASDNVMAETIGREVAAASGDPLSFAGAVDAVLEQLRDIDVDLTGARLMDSSGLSIDDRLTARTLDEVHRCGCWARPPAAAVTARCPADRRWQRHPVGPVPGRHHTRCSRMAARQDRIADGHQLIGRCDHRRQRPGADVRLRLQRCRSDGAGSARCSRRHPAVVWMQRMTIDNSSSAIGHAVDWGFAATVGARLARPAAPATEYTRRQAISELAASSRAAEPPVRDVTRLITEGPVPDARIVDRPEWIQAATESMRVMTGGADTPKRFLTGRVTGAQTGAVLAFVSSGILGQYDPFGSSADDGTGCLLLVYPNIIAVERQLRVSPKDFRLWVCLHEVTHRVQFTANPWLADYMSSTLAVLTDEAGEDVTAVVGRLSEFVKHRRRGIDDGPNSAGVLGFMRAVQSEPQRAALDRLLVLGTLLEGHADHVMDAVGPAVVPSVASIRHRFEERRKRKQPPLQRVLRALLGVDAKLAQYTRGKAFVDHVVDRVGMDRFNAVWTSRDTLPLPDEIDQPEQWIDRVL